MNRNLFKKSRLFSFVFLFFISFVNNCVFATDVIINNTNREAHEGPVANDLIVTGDSYAQHFASDEKGRDYRIFSYANENTTIDENMQTINRAFDSYGKYVLFSISVNDQVKGTHPNDFESSLRKILDKGKANNKIVFMHTYMHYPREYYYSGVFSSNDYDNVVRKLANEYPNVYYINMSDCSGVEYTIGDQIHYGKKFNDILYNRLVEMITKVLQ